MDRLLAASGTQARALMIGYVAPQTATPELPLTRCQVEILRRVVQGCSMKQIAYANRIATHPRAAAIRR
ncbi:hypothetical protein [Ideonella sp. YS5]|uniref:hypothetical protein n=1 Tax=Ideonella sp. YS5 TaxID=3453714 RepID=UPI003EEA6BF9